ncbi:aquaporin AQPAe.a-like [Clytia hemisphaerica]|uniref:Aquaporin n=1 Tax=Clytia hemisphaerica TaxID=252671 RepID=A0A7M5VEU8_9CNID
MVECCEEVKLPNFYVSIILESLASFLLVFIGGSVYVKYERPYNVSNVYEIAVVFGGMLTVLSECLKDVSKAHINPIITLASTLTKRISLLRALCYIVFQFAGALAGVYALDAMVPKAAARAVGMTVLSADTTLLKGLVFEMIFSFIYTWIHFASRNSRDTFKGFSGPLAIGIFYALSHIILVEHTGCSLNPARSLAPAIYENNFNELWVFIIGPFLAGALSGLVHDLIIHRSKGHPYPRARSCSITCCKPSREEVIMTNRNAVEKVENKVLTSHSSGPDIIIYPPLGQEKLV